MQKIIYLGPDEGFQAVQTMASRELNFHHVEAEDSAVAQALRSAAALLDASMRVRLTAEMIQAAPGLKIISCATTGSDHIDVDILARRGIVLATLRDDRELLQNLTPAAELSWALLMACARRLTAAFDHVKEGLWTRELFPGIMLRGKRLGLVGCGRIGSWMGRYAGAFGMEVVGYDPYVEPFPEHIKAVLLPELAETSDFISIHVHLSAETRRLISRELFRRMKKGVVLINTSRGAVIDESALLEALIEGRVAAAGVDVLEGEPDINNHPLVEYARRHDNLIITPHCGGFSYDAIRIVCRRAAEKIISYLLTGKIL